MSTFHQFFALSKKTTAILNKSNTTTASLNFAPNYLEITPQTVGELVAGDLSPVYSATGSGVINFLAAYSNDSTARTIRLKLTLDGGVVYDKTSASSTSSGAGLNPIGIWNQSTTTLALEPIAYNESILIEVASSLSETNKISILHGGYTTE